MIEAATGVVIPGILFRSFRLHCMFQISGSAVGIAKNCRSDLETVGYTILLATALSVAVPVCTSHIS